jgi:hypothetical protein
MIGVTMHSAAMSNPPSKPRTDSAARLIAAAPAALYRAFVDPAFAGEMIMTWSFDPVSGGTSVTIVAEQAPAGISADDHAAGLASSPENLAREREP